MSVHIASAARLLSDARITNSTVDWRHFSLPDSTAAYAVQDAGLRQWGPVGGWKVGRGADGQPCCAPLPQAGVLPSGVVLDGPQWRMRGLEAELALRVADDFDPGAALPTRQTMLRVFDAMLPVIEVVETRLANPPCTNPLVGLADLLSHGALVLGPAIAFEEAATDVRRITASVALDGQEVAHMTGANPAGDIWPLLSWLAHHCAQRGLPWKKGQIITTGSCTGVQHARPGARVHAQLTGLGDVYLNFSD
ncbi:2-keto-4-pentenoate hydratase [Herbaspirillum sp. alder98]|uniref:2-keto-4-pentenoate hydratase n=1 Tax=Herbaspirillum sp. alder98 TaxID=2913096 RepID=UPI001CD90A1B|nr:fumarylacetoacetate hydrolase family protein [Herbaspirillum sp. alder98]MCA1323211.1 fumarylacetoacetate hydrolase family protein [Herbaspirillum sp. alder98]